MRPNRCAAGEVAGAVAAIVEPPLAALGEPATPDGPLTPVEPAAETVEPEAVEALPATDPVAAGPVAVEPTGEG